MSDTPGAYMIVLGQPTDRDKMKAYSDALLGSGLYPENGGYYVAFGRPVEMFEGAWPEGQSIVVAHFPSREHARRFWYSERYQNDIKPLRAGAGTFVVSLHDELPREKPATGSDPVFVERRFVRLPHGQMHVWVAQPRAAGERKTPLIMLHQSPKSGRQMLALMRRLATDRICYAPDLPGFGDSDPFKTQPQIADYAAAVAGLIDGVGHPTIDIYGYHTGVLSAVELALARPDQIRRLVFVGLPLLNEAERDAIRQHPWPLPVAEDGSHLAAEWARSMRWAGPGQSLAQIAEGFVDKLKAGPTGHWGAMAAISYRLQDRLPSVTQPILVIGPKDDLWQASPRCKDMMRAGRFESWPDYGFGVMDVATDKLASAMRQHLDA